MQGDEATMRLTYHFLDGSIDDETTTYRQQGTFRLVRNHHIQQGPFFARPVDFAVEAATGTATTRTADRNGKIHDESEHIDLPDDLANGFVGTVLLNVPHNAAPFRVGILAPVGGGRLIRILISPEGERPFQARTDPQGDRVSHPSGVGWHPGRDCAAARPSAERRDGVGTGG